MPLLHSLCVRNEYPAYWRRYLNKDAIFFTGDDSFPAFLAFLSFSALVLFFPKALLLLLLLLLFIDETILLLLFIGEAIDPPPSNDDGGADDDEGFLGRGIASSCFLFCFLTLLLMFRPVLNFVFFKNSGK